MEKNLKKIIQEAIVNQTEYNNQLENVYTESLELSQNAFQSIKQEYLHAISINLEKVPVNVIKKIVDEIFQVVLQDKDNHYRSLHDIFRKNEVVLPKEFKSGLKQIYKDVKQISVMVGIYLPMIHVVAFIFNKKYLNIEDFGVILFRGRMEVSKLYDILKEMPEDKSFSLLKLIPCSSFIYDSLINFFRNNDKVKFVDTIHSAKININKISSACYLYEVYIHITQFDLYMCQIYSLNTAGRITLDSVCDIVSDELEKLTVDPAGRGKKEEELIANTIDHTGNIVFPFQEMYKDILDILNKWHLTSKELLIINKIIENPLYTDARNAIFDEQNQASQAIEKKEVMNENIDYKNFKLPDDYFKLSSNGNDNNSYIKNKRNFKASNRSVKTFTDFVNYIAEQGYIDSDLNTLGRFAFHLTGIRYPEDLELEEKVTWKGDIKALFYIIKKLCFVTHKYPSLKDFFISDHEDFKKASSASSYAERLENKDLKRKMYELYPDFFPKYEDEK